MTSSPTPAVPPDARAHDDSCPECGGNGHIGGDTQSPWACTRSYSRPAAPPASDSAVPAGKVEPDDVWSKADEQAYGDWLAADDGIGNDPRLLVFQARYSREEKARHCGDCVEGECTMNCSSAPVPKWAARSTAAAPKVASDTGVGLREAAAVLLQGYRALRLAGGMSEEEVGSLPAVAAITAALTHPAPSGASGKVDIGQANHDCLAKRRPDEPMFILLGRDPDAWQIVRMWAARRLTAGGDPEHCTLGFKTANAMRDYASDPANQPASAPPAENYPPPGADLLEQADIVDVVLPIIVQNTPSVGLSAHHVACDVADAVLRALSARNQTDERGEK